MNRLKIKRKIGKSKSILAPQKQLLKGIVFFVKGKIHYWLDRSPPVNESKQK